MEKRCMELMKRIDQLKKLWRCESQSSHGIPATVASSICKKVLSPMKVKRKGKSPVKRKVVVIKTVVKKSKVSSKPPRDNNAKKKRRKIQASKSTKNEDNTCQAPLPSAAHDHSTQDFITSSSTVAQTLGGHHNSILSQVDIRWVLTLDPLPLSQEVLLQLLWLLPYCININPAIIIAWMTDIFNSIIPTDPAIEMHVRPIFNEVYAALNHPSVLPTITNVVRLIIRLLMKSLLPP
ncbi:uncharacterized protein LOC133880370 [Alnus glutinosa]|uniref:uncharacterized protein LOC133880370 n=1 Tax=Alnus glutinosa TaxID=3517 RepID=UPI002D78D31A|nr:uncharacterized protein LOC133880370 [Alnus glutinosa]